MACMSTCCCCFTTYQGSIIIGVLSLLPGLVGIGFLSHLIDNWTTAEAGVQAWAQNLTDSLDLSNSQIPGLISLLRSTAADMNTMCVVVLICCVLLAISSLMLISGVYQASRCLMLPWLTFMLLRLLTFLVGIIIYFYVVGGISDGDVKQHFLSLGIVEVPDLLLFSYFWLCVFSHYHYLQQLEEQVYPIGEEEPVEVLPPVGGDEKY